MPSSTAKFSDIVTITASSLTPGHGHGGPLFGMTFVAALHTGGTTSGAADSRHWHDLQHPASGAATPETPWQIPATHEWTAPSAAGSLGGDGSASATGGGHTWMDHHGVGTAPAYQQM